MMANLLVDQSADLTVEVLVAMMAEKLVGWLVDPMAKLLVGLSFYSKAG